MENDGLVGVAFIVLLIFGLISMFGAYNGVSEKDLEDAIDDIEFPEQVSAQEIADLVVIPEMKEIDVPEFKGESMVKDMWEDMHSVNISLLKEHAYNDTVLEFKADKYEDLVEWLELNIEDFDELVGYEVKFNEDDCEVEVVELGLEEDEDKSAKVVCEVKVKYDLKEGADESYKKYVMFSSDVSYEEGDFSDEKVKFAYSFE